MSDISPSIISLLYEHDCVIVPGLGAFLSRRVGSAFDEQRGLMLPPRKEVVFNADIVHTDGVLADYLCRAEGLTYAEASKRIETFVADVRHRLNAGSVVLLPDLGSLSLADERIRFEAVSNLNVLIESYGLAPVAAERVRADIFEGFNTPAVRKAVASVAAVAVLLLVTPHTNDHDTVRADFSQAFTTGAVAGTVTGTVAGTVSGAAAGYAQSADANAIAAEPSADPSASAPAVSSASAPSATVPSATVSSAPEAVPSALALERVPAARVEEVAVPARTGAAAADGESVVGERFYLVVASFVAMQEARDYIASQRARGINDLEVLDYGGRCRVVAASFPNMSEAQSGNRDLQTVAGFEKSWVLRVAPQK